MSPQEINDQIIRINQDIPRLMDMISKERRPEERQRRGSTIKLKIDELIRLHEKRETVQQPVDDESEQPAGDPWKNLTKKVSDGLK